jgi:hypothetical protein
MEPVAPEPMGRAVSDDAARSLALADEARAVGDLAAVRGHLEDALLAARRDGDVARAVLAASALPGLQEFGVHPGRIPALVHDLHLAAPALGATPAERSRVAAALARAWAYGGDPARGRPFADDAVALAGEAASPEVEADALDAALVVRWGPDELGERTELARRLDDVAAHVHGTEPRLSAALWRLTTAWEGIDVVAVRRSLRGLDLLAEETGSARVGFFAASRAAARAVVEGDLDEARRRRDVASVLGVVAAEPDLEAVVHSIDAAAARVTGDTAQLGEEASAFEAFGRAQGVASVLAEAAVLWSSAGEIDQARAVAELIAGPGLDRVPRDVDFLLVLSCVAEVAAAAGEVELCEEAHVLLAPYAGRAVINAGAVSFHGTVDEQLARTARMLGRPGVDRWVDRARRAYGRLGARWWADRLEADLGAGSVAAPRTAERARRAHLAPSSPDSWAVGFEGRTTVVRDLKGLRYLRLLLARPGVELRAIDLSDAVAGHPGVTAVQGSTGDLVDERALDAYRRRLVELEAEIDEAGRWADRAREEVLAAERDALVEEITSAVGLAGRSRRPGGAEERARVAVRRAIAAAIARVAAHDPALGRLLDDTIRTGTVCRYDPDPGRPVEWVLEA